MTISDYVRTESQGFLFDEPLRGHGHVRTVVGECGEKFFANLLGGERHRTDSRVDYCPDISVPGGYIESKVVGKSKQAFIYTGRLEKDRAFVKAGYTLWYGILHHLANTKSVQTVEELRRHVLDSIQSVYLIPFPLLSDICSTLKVEPLNSAYYGPAGTQGAVKNYGSGFRISLKLLEVFKLWSWTKTS